MGGDVVGGHCKRECRTIEKACAGVLGSVESELGELLLDAIKAKTSAGVLGQRVCTKVKQALAHAVPQVFTSFQSCMCVDGTRMQERQNARVA